LAIKAPLINALVEIKEDDPNCEEPSSQGEDDQDIGESIGNSTIGYMEFEDEEFDEEEGTQGY
ncbi:hypothetical protein KI387_004427, partial [Taxus chinensis]